MLSRKFLLRSVAALVAVVAVSPTSHAAEPAYAADAKKAIERGLTWLSRQQQPDGSFQNPLNPTPSKEHPALTALPAIALQGPSAPAGSAEILAKAYAYIRSQARPDGGIYTIGLSNYNTSVCLMALLGTGKVEDEPLITRARSFIAGQQASGMAKAELDGGFGYGPTGSSPKRQHPDLDNTLIALEALKAYKLARPNEELAKGKDLNWQAAIDFVTRCQNLPSKNPMPWASDDAANKGGFVYYPGFSNAGEQELPGGKKALRSYGTISYAGLLSFIYADLSRDDERVRAALEWLGKNYTIEENPGLGPQGQYYYYQLAAKALRASGVESLDLPSGKKADWRAEITGKLISLQKEDGSWVNDAARWMEKDAVLVTAYSVIALQNILAK